MLHFRVCTDWYGKRWVMREYHSAWGWGWEPVKCLGWI